MVYLPFKSHFGESTAWPENLGAYKKEKNPSKTNEILYSRNYQNDKFSVVLFILFSLWSIIGWREVKNLFRQMRLFNRPSLTVHKTHFLSATYISRRGQQSFLTCQAHESKKNTHLRISSHVGKKKSKCTFNFKSKLVKILDNLTF